MDKRPLRLIEQPMSVSASQRKNGACFRGLSLGATSVLAARVKRQQGRSGGGSVHTNALCLSLVGGQQAQVVQ